MTTIHRTPIVAQRVRSIGGKTFAYLPHRFLREGFLASLAPDELRLYVLLVLAADRNGLSFYHYDSICSLLEITLETYIRARNGLIDKDLIAFDGTRFQVLSLPDNPRFNNAAPLTSGEDCNHHDSATIRALIHQSLGARRREIP